MSRGATMPSGAVPSPGSAYGERHVRPSRHAFDGDKVSRDIESTTSMPRLRRTVDLPSDAVRHGVIGRALPVRPWRRRGSGGRSRGGR